MLYAIIHTIPTQITCDPPKLDAKGKEIVEYEFNLKGSFLGSAVSSAHIACESSDEWQKYFDDSIESFRTGNDDTNQENELFFQNMYKWFALNGFVPSTNNAGVLMFWKQ